MGIPEIREFVTHLVSEKSASPSTQNQVLSSILFLYRHVLHIQLHDEILAELRPQKAKTVPVVLSKVEVKSVIANLDDSSANKLLFDMQGVIAEYERAQIADQMRRGNIHAMKNGQINSGNPPLGCRYVPKTKTQVGHLEINLEVEKIVRYIYHLYTEEKLSGTVITERLNDEAIPCRSSKWWSDQIYNVLKKEFSIGMMYMFRRRTIEPKHSPKTKAYRKRKNTSRMARSHDEWTGFPFHESLMMPHGTKLKHY